MSHDYQYFIDKADAFLSGPPEDVRGECYDLAHLLQRIDREAREECAKVCEEYGLHGDWSPQFVLGYTKAASDMAWYIRNTIQQPEAPAEGSGT